MPDWENPSDNEQEYFARHDAELIKEMREQADTAREQSQSESGLPLCPRCRCRNGPLCVGCVVGYGLTRAR